MNNNNHMEDEMRDLDLDHDDSAMEDDDLEMVDEDLDEPVYAGPSLRSRVISILTTILQTNLVWYVAGLVDGLILLKLFGG